MEQDAGAGQSDEEESRRPHDMPSPPLAGENGAARSKWAERTDAAKATWGAEGILDPSPRQSGRISEHDFADDTRANAPENPPWLSAQKPKLHHEQAVQYFFTHAPAASAKGQPLRFHMATGRIYVYGMIISQDLKANPGSRYVVFVPEGNVVKMTAAELRALDLKVGCVGEGNVFLEEDADVLVCAYDSAKFIQGRNFRIKVVEEADAARMQKTQHVYETQVRRGVAADLVVHFATLESGRSGGSGGPATGGATASPAQRMAAEEAGWLSWLTKPYNMMWKAIIRPPRASYAERDLGISTFVFGNHVYEREDVELKNPQGHKLACSHFYMRGGQALRQLCVVYLHGNCSSRLEAFYVLPALLARGLSVFCLDLAGSGLSGGEYISLGHHEEKDVSVVLEHLRSSGTASAIALWGRSMGAAAAVLRAAEDPDLAACVLDSPFADLRIVVEEYVGRMNLHIPNFVLSTCLAKVRKEIESRVGFDPYDLAPVREAPKATCPALFAVAHDDAFILPHHTLDLHNAWGGERLLSQFTGGHSGRRPGWFLDEAADFLLDRLSTFSSTRRSTIDRRRVFAL